MLPFQPLVFLTAIASVVFATTTCSVLDYGGLADNATDIGPAITKAYEDCVSGARTSDPADTVLLIPQGTYMIHTTVTFHAANYFTIEIDGNLNLIFDPSIGGNIFLFESSNYVVWKGTGAIYGHGDLWRPNDSLSAYPSRPRLVRFQDCNNVDISGVTLYNSPMFHLTIIGNNNVVHDMQIVADHIGETDGFDVSGNNNYVHDVSVENGDECVTVKSPTNGFVAENIQCFYSAGCNIGSFGKYGTASVQNVFYRNVTQSSGDAGIALKSFPSASGVVKNVTYEGFTLTGVAIPIMIDNFWCPHEACHELTGNITWQNVSFKSIIGTGDHTSRPVIDVDCLSGHQCSGLLFEGVTLTKEDNATVRVRVSHACGTGLSELPAC